MGDVAWWSKREHMSEPTASSVVDGLRQRLEGRAELATMIEGRFASKITAAKAAGLLITPATLRAIATKLLEELEREEPSLCRHARLYTT
jgi:transposase